MQSHEGTDQIDWTVYSQHYDALCEANPAYLENVAVFEKRLKSMQLGKGARICDVGAGTGTFLLSAGKIFHDAELHHVDFDPAMTNVARKKYADHRINVEIHLADVRDLVFPDNSFDLVICVNTLYSIPEPLSILSKMRSWTKPGGSLYVIDFGRQVELLDWALYILRNRVRSLGLKETIKWYKENSENLRQNRKGAKAQSKGSYWLHTTEQFRQSLLNTGWTVDLIETCYRDCCDLAICSNLPEPESPPEHRALPTP